MNQDSKQSMPSPLASIIDYGDGVVAIDSGFTRPAMAACYLLEAGEAVAVIETGTNDSVPIILDALKQRGYRADDVQYVIVTHVHLDHAGGAGSLMAECPNAQLLVHPRGMRHMVDPAKLEASVRQVYGDEQFDSDYGTLRPIAEQRVRAMEDGDEAVLNGRRLLFRDTPGHARHHFCVFDEQTRGWFTGDTFGLSYREMDTDKGAFIFPTTTPIQFDPEALLRSLNLLMANQPKAMYLTHFGRVTDLPVLADRLRSGVQTLVELALRHEKSATRQADLEQAIMSWLVSAAREHGVELSDEALSDLLTVDVVLNTQGLEFWLDHGRN